MQINDVSASKLNQTNYSSSNYSTNNSSINEEYVPNQIVIRFKENVTNKTQNQVYSKISKNKKVNITVLDESKMINGLKLIKISDNTKLMGVIDAFRLDSNIRSASINYIIRPTSIPNDTYFPLQWGLHNTGQTILGTTGTPDADIDAPEAWNISTGSNDVIVAVIDSGVDYTHPDLYANIWHNPGEIPGNGEDDDDNGYYDDTIGWDFVSNDNDPMAEDTSYNDLSDGHGTHCAGIIGAVSNNNLGVSGVMQHVKIMPIRFLGPDGGTKYQEIHAIGYATMMGASVISCSYGGAPYDPDLESLYGNSSALIVCAAGNDGINTDSSPHYPSCYNCPNIISVAATNNQDQLASFLNGKFSNYGVSSVDLAAPGVGILSTFPLFFTPSTGVIGYEWMEGTSMATPFVSGVAGLIKSINPLLTNIQIKNIILNNVDPLSSLNGLVATGGRLNAYKAVYAAYLSVPKPDLIATAISGPSSARIGDNIPISVTIKNQGTADAGSSVTKVYLSTDPNNQTFYIGQLNFPSIAAGSSNTQTSTFIVPTIASGNYYFTIQVDANNQIAESDENNGFYDPGQIIITAPDLIVPAVNGPSSARVGDSIQISVTIKNQGTGNAGSSVAKLYLSTDPNNQTSYVYLGQLNFPSIAAGVSNTQTSTFTVPTMASGNYYITIIADANNQIPESDESNLFWRIATININNTMHVINVRTGIGYNTIQAAIDDTNTTNGDTLNVNAGTYIENVVVNKSLSIIANGLAIIQALDINLPVFTITSTGSGSKIQGFNINGSSNSEIYLNNASGLNITNNTINGTLSDSNSKWGICLDNHSNGNNITNNTVTNCEEGINLYDSHQNTISSNTVKNNHWDNMALNLSTLNNITGNTISNADSGIRLIGGSNNNTISNNDLTANIWTSISLDGSLYNNITLNLLNSNQIGMYLYSSNNNTIDNNTANNNVWEGIAIHDSSYNIITRNTHVTGNYGGVRLRGTSTGNEIMNNDINGNIWSDISLETATANIIHSNTLSNAHVGLYLYEASNNQIYNNTIQNNTWDGIDVLSSSNNNTISNNTISGTTYYGERIEGSTGNTSYRNNYINNTIQAYDDSTNNWDNGTTGNYWSDWNSTNPRPITGGSSMDNHPSLVLF